MTARATKRQAAREAATSAARFTLADVEALRIRRLVADSRAVAPGDTFVAFPGERQDGRRHIGEALDKGAASVLWERRGFVWNPGWRVPNLAVTDLRKRAGEIASHVYGRPSAKLWTIGVTGTNGKSSCSHWIAQSLTHAGRRCAVIGTLGSGFSGRLDAAENTTPDAVRLHGMLRKFLRGGARSAAMEVSSHGLMQHRLSGVEFDVALFTNLTRDHLDYHHTMRRYRDAKARLFDWPTLKWAVLNLDDRFGAALVARAQRPGVNVIGYGFACAPAGGERRLPRVEGRNLRLGADGLTFDVVTPWGSTSLSSTLIGRFNASNLLGALATLLASDVGLERSVNALRRVRAVPGRLERHGGVRLPLVVIDYAHTPDALEQVLRTVRETVLQRSPRTATGARLICVFGCGGERDRGKRPLMGAAAARLADQVVLTSDNPRSENPEAIIEDIRRGAANKAVTIEPDRARAIALAIQGAAPGDAVLIAGKGHERYQEIGGVRHPFSDAAVVTAALRKMRGRAR